MKRHGGFAILSAVKKWLSAYFILRRIVQRHFILHRVLYVYIEGKLMLCWNSRHLH